MIYQKEVEKAIMWLFETQNKESFGWSWVRDISPNEQNTAEVVYATALFCDILSKNQKQLINEAVRKWLLVPEKHAVLTIDWAWVGLALSKYAEHIDVFAVLPTPVENAPNAPYVQVWESAPIITSPATVKPFSGRSACSIPISPTSK